MNTSSSFHAGDIPDKSSTEELEGSTVVSEMGDRKVSPMLWNGLWIGA